MHNATRVYRAVWHPKTSSSLKEHNHVFARAQVVDFWTGGREFKDARIKIELSQLRLHRPQSTLALS